MVAAVCSIGILIPVVAISVAAKDPVSKTVVVAIAAGALGWLIAAPWWFYVSVIRRVLVVDGDSGGQVVVREGIGRYTFRTRTVSVKGGRIDPVSFMSQRLSGGGKTGLGVQLYLESKDHRRLQELFLKNRDPALPAADAPK